MNIVLGQTRGMFAAEESIVPLLAHGVLQNMAHAGFGI